MNTPPNAMPQFRPESQIIAPAEIPAIRRFYWSVLRELWENRSLYSAPLAVAALIIVASLVGTFHLLPGNVHDSALDPAKRQELIQQPFTFAAMLLMFTTFLVGMFYCLDSLQSERRDRSILFWKSLPVSDLITVLSKASVPIIVLPLITVAVTVVTQGIMLLLASARLLGSGQSATLWSDVPLFSMSVMLLYHMVAVHALWWAPLWGWLFLVSAWARRAAYLWATLPLLAIGILEKIAFNTSHFAAMLQHRFLGGPEGVASSGDNMSMASLTPETPGQFLTSPGLWIGLAFAAACLVAAARLRRDREPI
jgi:ABC-2 type transport system permease protein